MIKSLDEKWTEPPAGTRDRLLHLLDVLNDVPNGIPVVRQLDEIQFTMPGVMVPAIRLTVGDLRILADIAIHREYAMDGETGSEITVGL